MSGTEFARKKEDTAAIMRAKQAAGKLSLPFFCTHLAVCCVRETDGMNSGVVVAHPWC
jgi:hypothetical protein